MKVLSITVNSNKLNSIISDIRTKYGPLSTPSRPHITIRGPFLNISDKIVSEAKRIVSDPGMSIVLEGLGYFSVNKQIYVYIAANAPGLRRVWRKPDYPLTKGFFNPHITIYRGNNMAVAERIIIDHAHFQDTISCKNISLALDYIGQGDLSFD